MMPWLWVQPNTGGGAGRGDLPGRYHAVKAYGRRNNDVPRYIDVDLVCESFPKGLAFIDTAPLIEARHVPPDEACTNCRRMIANHTAALQQALADLDTPTPQRRTP